MCVCTNTYKVIQLLLQGVQMLKMCYLMQYGVLVLWCVQYS